MAKRKVKRRVQAGGKLRVRGMVRNSPRGPERAAHRRRGERSVFETWFRTPRMDSRMMLGALRDFSERRGGRVFRYRDFNRWSERPCSASAIANRLGGWNRAMARAGLVMGKRSLYEPEELVANLEAVWKKMGRAPGGATLVEHGPISPGPYQRVWGSLKRACERLAQYKRGDITREMLLAPCREKRRVPVSAGKRWQVLGRDGCRCVVCGRGASEGEMLHVDHIVPVSRGGGNEMANLRTLCARCNLGRGKGNGEATWTARTASPSDRPSASRGSGPGLPRSRGSNGVDPVAGAPGSDGRAAS